MPGFAGGSSIGLVLLRSADVSFDDVSICAAAGGHGGFSISGSTAAAGPTGADRGRRSRSIVRVLGGNDL
ncbi:MAG: hypothetical protein ACJA1R_001649 [Flavobacteriales bacterium]|jgi:hypothetical protein